jgi:hypothetical protein
MTEITEPKNALDDAVRSMRRLRPLRFFFNRWQKVSFWFAMAAAGLGFLLTWLFNKGSWPQPQWPWWATLALLAILMFYFSMFAYSLLGIVSSINPRKSLFVPMVEVFDAELGLIVRLAQTYDRRDLEYALDRLTLEVTRVRTRIALLIGALDKVWVIPLAIGAFFPSESFSRLSRRRPPN